MKYSIMKTIRAISRQSTILQLYDTSKQKLVRNLDREAGSFVWLQLIKEVIEKISASAAEITSEDFNGKQEMLRQCREYYRNNDKEMKNINEFEQTYNANEAIWWYTKDSFIFKLINKALRTEDIDVLYTFRFYIVDLCRCLFESSQLLREYTSAPTFKVYRGMKQSHEEVQRLKDSVGQLISANTFLSASRSKQVAEVYAGVTNNTSIRNDLESFIFEIEIDMEADFPVVVADVSCYSHFKDEEEILFDLATVFEITSMSYHDTRKFWLCCMKTSSKGHDIAQEYIKLERAEMNNGDVVLLLGILLFEMGEYHKSIVYFNHLKDRRPEDAYVRFMLGKAHGVLYENEQALAYYKSAYRLSMNKDPPDLVHAALVNTYAGVVYYYECNYEKALIYHKDSLNKYKIANMTDQLVFAHALIGTGYVYHHMSQDQIALEYFQRALEIFQRLTPFEHPDLSRAHRHVATVLCQMGDYNEALHSMKISLEIGRQVFPRKSLAFAAILNSLGKVLYKKGHYEEALEQHLAAIKSNRYTLPQQDSLILVLPSNNIGKIFYRMKKYHDAIEQYDKVMVILTTAFSKDHIYTAYTLKNKGELFLALNDLDSAADYLNRSLQMYERIFIDREHRDKAKCKYLMGCLNIIRGDNERAMCLFRQAYETWSKTVKVHYPDRDMCLKKMSQLRWRKISQWIIKHKVPSTIFERKPH